MAMSVNGFVARTSGNEDFLSEQNWTSFCELAQSCGCLVIGRKTYEAVLEWDEEYNFDTIIGIEKVIITQNADYVAKEGYIIASSPVDAIQKLQDYGHQKILVTGGPSINSAFMTANLIDEVILNIEPIILGAGKSLFSISEFESKLELLSSKKIKDGILQLHYRVVK